MQSTPLISVIIPSHNRAYTLPRALDSVLAQALPADEIIVIDDGSTDNTDTLLRQQYPDIYYHKQTQHGVSHARNTGVKLARGRWIALLDSDDAWQPQKLLQQIPALQTKPNYLLCHTNESWIRNGKPANPTKKYKKHGGHIFKHCLPACAISPSSALIHRDIFDTIGYFDENLTVCEDYDLWLRITAQHPVLYLDKPLTVKYGGHPDQLSTQFWGMDRFRIKALQKILDSHTLNTDNQQAALAMLQQKIRIYLIGAHKRNKTDDITHYEKLLKQYC
jgi:glycosyltransferase involved in cell wall biosynthesis